VALDQTSGTRLREAASAAVATQSEISGLPLDFFAALAMTAIPI
jgi:hypothetical protein